LFSEYETDPFYSQERLTIEYRDRLMHGINNAGLVLNEYDLAIRVVNRFKIKTVSGCSCCALPHSDGQAWADEQGTDRRAIDILLPLPF
jgi:hypothetical protein